MFVSYFFPRKSTFFLLKFHWNILSYRNDCCYAETTEQFFTHATSTVPANFMIIALNLLILNVLEVLVIFLSKESGI